MSLSFLNNNLQWSLTSFSRAVTLALTQHTSHTVISLSCCHWLLLKTNGAGRGWKKKYYELVSRLPAVFLLPRWTALRQHIHEPNCEHAADTVVRKLFAEEEKKTNKKTVNQTSISRSHFQNFWQRLTSTTNIVSAIVHGCLHQKYEMPAWTGSARYITPYRRPEYCKLGLCECRYTLQWTAH